MSDRGRRTLPLTRHFAVRSHTLKATFRRNAALPIMQGYGFVAQRGKVGPQKEILLNSAEIFLDPVEYIEYKF